MDRSGWRYHHGHSGDAIGDRRRDLFDTSRETGGGAGREDRAGALELQPKLDPLTKKVLFSPYSRGVAVGHGKVFIGTVDGRGIALDQKTGKEDWQVQLTDSPNCHGYNFTSPPVVAGDIADLRIDCRRIATQGKIFGVEATSGKKVWEFNTIKDDPKSWPGTSGKYGGGGAWMPGTYDAETEHGLLRHRQSGEGFHHADRQGDNLYRFGRRTRSQDRQSEMVPAGDLSRTYGTTTRRTRCCCSRRTARTWSST